MTDRPTNPNSSSPAVPPELLSILVCPVDKGALRDEISRLVCTVCGRRYAVEDGIPNMLADYAETAE